MAWIEPLPNGGYRGMWRDASGRRRSASFDRDTKQRFDGPKGEQRALAYAIGQEAIARNNGPQADRRGLTWGQWRERWLQLRQVEPATLKTDLGRIKRHLNPHWEKTLIRRIDATMVQAWVNKLTADPALSPATVARIYHLFSASMKAAVKARQIPANPCQMIDLPTATPGKERFLTRAELKVILDHIDDKPARAVVLFLAYTGLRWGEMAGLHWSRVDMVSGTVTVVETWDQASQLMKGFSKSKKPRTVPLTPELLAMLGNRPADTGRCPAQHVHGSRCTSSLVFPGVDGRPLEYTTFRRRHWVPAIEYAKLPHTRLHDLRHTYASWLVQDGVSIRAAQKLLGHATVTTTERYSHIGTEQYERVLAALGR